MSLFCLLDQFHQREYFGFWRSMKNLFPFFGTQFLSQILFHQKMFKPAIESLKTGQTATFPFTVGKGDPVTESGAPDLVIFARRGSVFLHVVGFQE